MSFFATLVLVFLLIIRPQEIWPALGVLHLLDVFTGLAVLGIIIDFATGKEKDPYSPQLPFLGAFVGANYLGSIVMLGVHIGVSQATTNARRQKRSVDMPPACRRRARCCQETSVTRASA